jgi:CheY-like chemotaxis protein
LMPVMNGIEATKYLRQMNPRPYIIAVSAAVQNSDKQRCQQVGVDSYLTKPVLKEKLNAALLPLVTD